MRRQFNGLLKLARMVWKRDRISLLIWVLSIAAVTSMVAIAYFDLYPLAADRNLMAQTLQNPALVAMIGPVFGLDDYHYGAMVSHEMLLFTAIAVAIMNIIFVVKHTRGDEETGRIEILRSLPTGRLANVSSVLLVSLIANVVLGLVVAVGLFVLGIESINVAGSILYGCTLAVTGLFFAVFTVLCAQLSESARGALGYAFAGLGVAYVVRAIGDVGESSLSLFSPLGIILRTQAYVNNNWVPVGVVLVEALICVLIAFYLNHKRDLGAGLIASRPGRSTASRWLSGPVGLVLRLEKTMLIGWAVGLWLIGISYGSVLGDIDSFFASSDILIQILPETGGDSLVQEFVALLMALMAIMSTVPALLVVLKLSGEEKAGRIDQLLARSVSRTRLMLSFIIPAMLVAVLIQLLSSIGLWMAGMFVMDQPLSLVTTIKTALAYVPALWVMLGIATLLIGVVPRLTNYIWLYLGYSFFVVYLGGLLQLPAWMNKISVFGSIPTVPLEAMTLSVTLFLLLLTVVLIGLGLNGYRKRDIAS